MTMRRIVSRIMAWWAARNIRRLHIARRELIDRIQEEQAGHRKVRHLRHKLKTITAELIRIEIGRSL